MTVKVQGCSMPASARSRHMSSEHQVQVALGSRKRHRCWKHIWRRIGGGEPHQRGDCGRRGCAGVIWELSTLVVMLQHAYGAGMPSIAGGDCALCKASDRPVVWPSSLRSQVKSPTNDLRSSDYWRKCLRTLHQEERDSVRHVILVTMQRQSPSQPAKAATHALNDWLHHCPSRREKQVTLLQESITPLPPHG